ncbi:hypothetical protein [Priestia megaterium]|nr:hypothetical protein [Priestia megaterium]MED3972274.1 hypothetical protein [Priestia megaterium]
MKINVWEYAQAFKDMKSVYDNLGLDDNWLETLDNHDQLISNDVKAS